MNEQTADEIIEWLTTGQWTLSPLGIVLVGAAAIWLKGKVAP